MLDDFNLEQPIVYTTMINSIKKNRLSHAYIIETNGYPRAFDLAKAFAKYLLCPHSYSNSDNCKNCNQCQVIDKNEFIELKIIEPDGQWIKKSQLEELQDIFSKKSIIGNKKVYILTKADKLNVSSSNSLLKFLEEPEDGIYAILIVDNISQLLSTIVSRCQVLSLKNNKKLDELSTLEKLGNFLNDSEEKIKEYVLNDESVIKLEKVIEFIDYYEQNHFNTLIYINKLWHDHFKEKDEIYNAFTIMLLFYKDMLNLKLGRNVETFNDYIDCISKNEKRNELEDITRKINVIMNLREKIKFNVNNNMLMDKLIIELERCDN